MYLHLFRNDITKVKKKNRDNFLQTQFLVLDKSRSRFRPLEIAAFLVIINNVR